MLGAQPAARHHQAGAIPPGVDQPEVYRQRSGGAILPEGTSWVEATAELRKAYVPHPELNPALAGRDKNCGDAELVQRARRAGAVVWGKTNVPLMLGDWQTYNAIYGTTYLLGIAFGAVVVVMMPT